MFFIDKRRLIAEGSVKILFGTDPDTGGPDASASNTGKDHASENTKGTSHGSGPTRLRFLQDQNENATNSNFTFEIILGSQDDKTPSLEEENASSAECAVTLYPLLAWLLLVPVFLWAPIEHIVP